MYNTETVDSYGVTTTAFMLKAVPNDVSLYFIEY